MSRRDRKVDAPGRAFIGGASAGTVALLAIVLLWSAPGPAAPRDTNGSPVPNAAEADLTGRAGKLLRAPVVEGVYPGIGNPDPIFRLGALDDPASIQRGMRYFNQFNCVGCHAPNGAGGMGPSLSNAAFKHGGEPENVFLSIAQGRSAGMPAWGSSLSDTVIWDLVAYIESISREPKGTWGKTVSAGGFKREQVPAQYLKTTKPWDHTQPFSYGQPPFVKLETRPMAVPEPQR